MSERRRKIQKQWPADTSIIPVANGIIHHGQNGCFFAKEHDPETDYFIATPYQRDADPEAWTACLDKLSLTPEHRIYLQKMFGYCLTRVSYYDKAFLLYGPGWGKSTLLYILSKLLGDEHIAALSLPDMDQKFRVSQLYNRLVNIDLSLQDGPPRRINDQSRWMLKSIASGDLIIAEIKYGDVIQFRPFAKYVAACPTLPDSFMSHPGIPRRFVCIEFPAKDGDSAQPTPDIEDIVLRDHAPAILNWALAGLKMLIRDGGF